MSDNQSNSNSGSFLPEAPAVDGNSAHITEAAESNNIESLMGKMFKTNEETVEEVLGEKGEEVPLEVKGDDKFASKFAALTRKEKQIREYQNSLKAKEQQLAAKDQEYNKLIELREKDPKKFLEAVGLSVDDLVNLYLDNQVAAEVDTKPVNVDPALKALQDKIEQLENQTIEKEKQALKKQEEAVINGFKQEINTFLESDQANYELILSNKLEHEVFNLIEQHYAETKKILDVKEAADMVEDYLFQEAQKLLNLNKIKSKVGLNQAAKPSNDGMSESNFTLTNTQASSRPTNTGDLLSDRESIEKLSQLLKWD
jgi:hypothetical protein